jgi:hypothetical protein
MGPLLSKVYWLVAALLVLEIPFNVSASEWRAIHLEARALNIVENQGVFWYAEPTN